MKYMLVAATFIVLASPALADPSADEATKADTIRECVLNKVGGHEAFGKAAMPIPHQPRLKPNGQVDLGYGNRRPQPFTSLQEPTVTQQELQHAASQCRHENP
jgi:hypothetical protein